MNSKVTTPPQKPEFLHREREIWHVCSLDFELTPGPTREPNGTPQPEL